jgi:hypothetical protein
MKVSWDDDIPNILKVLNSCSKPPTSTNMDDLGVPPILGNLQMFISGLVTIWKQVNFYLDGP